MPRYHGRVQVELLGEELDGRLIPPVSVPSRTAQCISRRREEKLTALHPDGDLRLGVLMGDPDVTIGIPSDRKSVLPRHLAVLGTTGGGKSTTIGRLISQAQAADVAVVLLDTEGEYVQMGEPTDDEAMVAALRAVAWRRLACRIPNYFTWLAPTPRTLAIHGAPSSGCPSLPFRPTRWPRSST